MREVGWEYGPAFDERNRLHDSLVPFESLSPRDQRQVVQAVRALDIENALARAIRHDRGPERTRSEGSGTRERVLPTHRPPEQVRRRDAERIQERHDIPSTVGGRAAGLGRRPPDPRPVERHQPDPERRRDPLERRHIRPAQQPPMVREDHYPRRIPVLETRERPPRTHPDRTPSHHPPNLTTRTAGSREPSATNHSRRRGQR